MTSPELELPPSVDMQTVLGLIALLQDAELVVYRPGTPFPDDFPDVAAVLQRRPDKPDRVASFTPYPVSQDADQAMDRLGVQIWMRYAGQNPRAVGNLAGAVRDTLHGLTGVDLVTGVRMSQCLRSSGSSLGQDTAGRWSWVENFYCDIEHQTAHRH